jgi:hypothetical protein
MTTRTDAELEAIYKAGLGDNHAAALRAVYQTGRGDEQTAMEPPPKQSLLTRIEEDLGLQKRPVKNPGDPSDEISTAAKTEPEPEADSPTSASPTIINFAGIIQTEPEPEADSPTSASPPATAG